VLVERDAGMLAAQGPCQNALALLDGQSAQILAVQFQQVKSAQYNNSVTALAAKQVEHRRAVFVAGDCLARRRRITGPEARRRQSPPNPA